MFRAGVTRLRDAMASSQPVAAGSALGRSLAALADLGASPNLLTACHAVTRMQAGLALASAATDRGFDVVELEAIYARIGETLGLAWLYATIPINVVDSHWVQLAKAALRDELAALTVAIALDVLAAGGLQAWVRLHEDALARAHSAYAGLASSIEVDVAMLTVGVQVLRDLCHVVGVRE